MHPLVTPILFAIVASPSTYKLTRSIGGDWIASSDGHAKMGGLILHAIVMALLLRFVWKTLKAKKSGFGQMLSGATFYGKGGETHRSGLGEMDDSPNIKGYPIDGSDPNDEEYMD